MDKQVKQFIADRKLSDDDILSALRKQYEEAEEQPAEEEAAPEQVANEELAEEEEDVESERDPDSKEDLESIVRKVVGDVLKGKAKPKPKPTDEDPIGDVRGWGMIV